MAYNHLLVSLTQSKQQVISNRKADFPEDSLLSCLGHATLKKYKAEWPQDGDLGKGMLTLLRGSAEDQSFRYIR